MIRDFWALQRLEGLQTANKLRDNIARRPLTLLFLFLMGLFFFGGYLFLSYKLLGFVFEWDDGDSYFAGKLVLILFFIALGVSLMSSLTTAIANFYLSKDLEFQFSLPVSFDGWVLHRFVQVFLQSNWMLVLFGAPFVWLFFHFSKAGLLAQILGVMVFLMLATFPVLAATILCMVLVKVFPARRVHQVLLVLTVVLVSSFVLVFRYMEPENFLRTGGMQQFAGLVSMLDLERQQWNPAIWAYNVVAVLSQGQWAPALPHAARLIALFALGVGGLLAVARGLYRASWDRALQSLSGEPDLSQKRKRGSRLSRWLSRPSWSQEVRELLLFFRDPSQWSQIFVLLALLGLYLFSLTKLPVRPFGESRFLLAMGNSAFVGFISLSVASRFVFTSFSADGHAIWIMKTVPEGWLRFIRGKLLVYGLPTLIFSQMLGVFSGVMLQLEGQQLWIIAIHNLWDSLFMILLALCFGMLFINPNIENPMKLIVSPGGLLLMVCGLFTAGLHASLRLSERSWVFNRMLMRIGWPDFQVSQAGPYYAGLIVVEALILAYLLRRGAAYLRRGDFL